MLRRLFFKLVWVAVAIFCCSMFFHHTALFVVDRDPTHALWGTVWTWNFLNSFGKARGD